MKTKYQYYLFAFLFLAVIGIVTLNLEGHFPVSYSLTQEIDSFLNKKGFQGSVLISKGEKFYLAKVMALQMRSIKFLTLLTQFFELDPSQSYSLL